MFIVFESLACNLYEFIKKNHHLGFSLDNVRDFAFQLLRAVECMSFISIESSFFGLCSYS
jgi:hypothetical protein